jgi:hypothetical protein
MAYICLAAAVGEQELVHRGTTKQVAVAAAAVDTRSSSTKHLPLAQVFPIKQELQAGVGPLVQMALLGALHHGVVELLQQVAAAVDRQQQPQHPLEAQPERVLHLTGAQEVPVQRQQAPA